MSATVDLKGIRWGDWIDDPYPLYRVLRDEAPVFFDEGGGVFVVSRYDDVSEVLRDHTRFSSRVLAEIRGERPQLSPLKEEDPPLHTYRRRVVASLFSIGQMRRLSDYFARVARELLDGLDNDSVVEVSSRVAVPLSGRVTADLIGVPFEHHERFRDLTMERIELLFANRAGAPAPGPGVRSIDEVRADLWQIIGPLAERRASDPRDDAISLLVAAQRADGGEQLTEELFLNILLTLIAGGLETTQHLVELLVSLFADRPDLWQRLDNDRSLIDRAIEEMLRWDAPFQAGRRRALVEIELGGVAIPADSTLMPLIGSANRDERVFVEPDTYDIDRDLSRHMAFGFGIHYCPGAPVSRFEVRALLNEMLDRYARIERAGPSERSPTRAPKRTAEAMRGYRSVPIRLHHR